MSMAIDIDPDTNTVRAERSLRSSGSSTVISFPPQILQALNLEVNDDVEIVADWEKDEIRIKKVVDEE
jgi:antitoxin component of MazEF toxin-antitoxin module